MSTATALAQLRHLYGHMVNGRLGDPAEAARGLLGPAIEALERALTPTTGLEAFQSTGITMKVPSEVSEE